MSDIYRTIASRAEGMYKDKGSKFLSFALPVENVEEIKKIIKDFQHQYHDARHVCYAYVLGNEKKDWRANDAGEPSGTAGRPILRQINTRNLTNVLVIVVRYFGGILLGTSGLINAYSEAASDALNHAEIIEKTVQCHLKISFDFLQLNSIMKIIKEQKLQVIVQEIDNEKCSIELAVAQHEVSDLIKIIQNISGTEIEVLNR
ncbi:MAG TPA: YigZ family protein [Paludibacteraceae bacterium]|nr:YigZ family protein [Paludibacteraceae bacterium]